MHHRILLLFATSRYGNLPMLGIEILLHSGFFNPFFIPCFGYGYNVLTQALRGQN